MTGMNWLAKQFTFEEFQVIEMAIIHYKDICETLNVKPSFESFVESYALATTQRREHEHLQGKLEEV